jgi:2-dehydro-3-deoxygluconokinase
MKERPDNVDHSFSGLYARVSTMHIHASHAHFRVDHATELLCIGETMVVVASTSGSPLEAGGSLALSVGGAESNVAVGVRRAGHSVAWASLLGEDRFGDIVEEHLRGRGVDTCLVERRAARTGLYVKSIEPRGTVPIYYRAGSAATEMDAELARGWAKRMTPRIVHVSGITAQISAPGRALLRAVCEDRVFGDALVSFDVNHRPALASSETPDELAALARASDIVFVGADEAATIWGTVAEDVPRFLRGPRHVIVKDAAVSAIDYSDGARVESPALRVDVVEAVGAGDAFAGGWLGAFLDGLPAVERLGAGHAAAARVLASPTDLPEEAVDPIV